MVKRRIAKRADAVDEDVAIVHLALGTCLLASGRPNRCACSLVVDGKLRLPDALEIYKARKAEVVELAKRYQDGTYAPWIENFIAQ